MLQGQLDPATPVAQTDQLSAITPERFYVKVPLAGQKSYPCHTHPFVGHVTSLLAAVGLSCPLDILLKFGKTGQMDASCISSMPTTIDFAGITPEVQATALQYFGTVDLWGM